MDVNKSPYAEFLEKFCQTVIEGKPDKIAVVALMPDGTSLTANYGDCGPFDIATMAFHLQTDAMFEIFKANAKEILEAAEEQED